MKGWVFRRDFKFCNESQLLIGCGSELQTVETAVGKAVSRSVKSRRQVGRCYWTRLVVMEGRVDEEEEFEFKKQGAG